ncbi:MAG: hypothetical protein P4L22_04505 [Candidatus Babeliales bacterium]|nr:hypothetical protein [Candidatus Babeliales bacterium]
MKKAILLFILVISSNQIINSSEACGCKNIIEIQAKQLEAFKQSIYLYKNLFHTQKQELIPKIEETQTMLANDPGNKILKHNLELLITLESKLIKQNLKREAVLQAVAEFNKNYKS